VADRRDLHRGAVRAEAGQRSSTASRWAWPWPGVSLPIFFTGLIALETVQLPGGRSSRKRDVRFRSPRKFRTCGPGIWCWPWVCLGVPLRGAVRRGWTRGQGHCLEDDEARDYIRTANARRDCRERTVIVKQRGSVLPGADADHHDSSGWTPLACCSGGRHPHRGSRSTCTASACSRSRARPETRTFPADSWAW